MSNFWIKYRLAIILTGIFVLFIVFIAPGNLIKTAGIKNEIRKLNRQQRMYREQAKEDSTFLENLKDNEFLEKYARERFYMKRKGEEIYIVEE